MADVDTGWSYMLSQAYLAGLPVARTLWGKAVSALSHIPSSDPCQEDVLVEQAIASTINHPVSRLYPRDLQHQLETLKYIQEVFHKRSGNLRLKLEELIKICEVDLANKPQLKLAYKTYVYDPQFFTQCNQTSGEKIEWDEQLNQKRSERGSVTLLESCGPTAHWTTGLTSWGGGAVMADWVNSNPQVLKGRSVLELGSGVGYLAAAILKECANNVQDSGQDPISYTATDCHPQVLRLLELNLRSVAAGQEETAETITVKTVGEEHRRRQETMCRALEQEETMCRALEQEETMCRALEQEETMCRALEQEDTAETWPCETRFSVGSVSVHVRALDWLSPSYPPPSFDVILAADVVYDTGLTPHLVTTIRNLLQNCATTSEPSAYIACTRRNQASIDFFLSCAAEQQLSTILVYKAALDIDYSLFAHNESHLPVQIFKVSLM